MDLIEETRAGDNVPEYTVAEIAGAVRRVIEGELGWVRIRGEVGRVVHARSGHLYFDLKDDRNVLSCMTWKGQVPGLGVIPEEGMEVVAEGRMTASGFQSKFALNAQRVAVAGAGALMALLEKRKKALAAEGLFDAARKRPLPYLPEVIGVVTSPQGAVIRDILHRLRERFPRRVLIWPVAVQGQACAPDVARAIAGFNRLAPGGPVPRPDLLIVARGGGSIEDLWGFNEEEVARAAAASDIPLISAVGHETDTTLIDHVADRRAPTPTAAAEMAVPVRAELQVALREAGFRLDRALTGGVARQRQRLRDLSRAMPSRDRLLAAPRQRLDRADRLAEALTALTQRKRSRLVEAAASLRPAAIRGSVRQRRERVETLGQRLAPTVHAHVRRKRTALEDRTRRMRAELLLLSVETRRAGFDRMAARLRPAADAVRTRKAEALAAQLRRMRLDALRRDLSERRTRVSAGFVRLNQVWTTRRDRWADRLSAMERMRQTLGYEATLRRGYAVVRGDGDVVTGVAAARRARRLELQFADGRLDLGKRAAEAAPDDPGPPEGDTRAAKRLRRKRSTDPEQGSLF